VADDERVVAGGPGPRPHDLSGDPRLLRAGDEVVDQHAEPPSRRRAEVADDAGEVVDAVQRLDDDALDAQVVAPDLLDELGVVLALDVDAPLAGDPRLRPGDVGRARGAARRAGRRRRSRPDQHDRPPVDPEARPERVGPHAAFPVLEVDDVLLAPDDGAHEAAARVLDHEVALGDDLRHRLLHGARVDQVVVGRTGRHPSMLGRRPHRRGETRRGTHRKGVPRHAREHSGT